MTVRASYGGRVILGTQVYADLRADIIRGVIAPGDKLVETEVAGRFGVSRTPTREALRRLEAEGLAHRDGAGLVATPYDIDTATEVLLLRQLLEPKCGESSAPHLGERDFVRLESTVREMAVTRSSTSIALAELNNRFHDALYARCPYPRLLDEVRRVRDHPVTYILYETYTEADRDRVVTEHAAIVKLARRVAQRDVEADALAGVLDAHIGKARTRIEENLRAAEQAP